MATYKEFQEALAADEGLRARFTRLAKELDSKDEDEALAAKCAVAAKLGFDVPASEFRLAMLAARELDNEELDSVAGGRPVYVFTGMAERALSSMPGLTEGRAR